MQHTLMSHDHYLHSPVHEVPLTPTLRTNHTHLQTSRLVPSIGLNLTLSSCDSSGDQVCPSLSPQKSLPTSVFQLNSKPDQHVPLILTFESPVSCESARHQVNQLERTFKIPLSLSPISRTPIDIDNTVSSVQSLSPSISSSDSHSNKLLHSGSSSSLSWLSSLTPTSLNNTFIISSTRKEVSLKQTKCDNKNKEMTNARECLIKSVNTVNIKRRSKKRKQKRKKEKMKVIKHASELHVEDEKCKTMSNANNQLQYRYSHLTQFDFLKEKSIFE